MPLTKVFTWEKEYDYDSMHQHCPTTTWRYLPFLTLLHLYRRFPHHTDLTIRTGSKALEPHEAQLRKCRGQSLCLETCCAADVRKGTIIPCLTFYEYIASHVAYITECTYMSWLEEI